MSHAFTFVINHYMILKIIKSIKLAFYIYWRAVDYYAIYTINDNCIRDIKCPISPKVLLPVLASNHLLILNLIINKTFKGFFFK